MIIMLIIIKLKKHTRLYEHDYVKNLMIFKIIVMHFPIHSYSCNDHKINILGEYIGLGLIHCNQNLACLDCEY